MKKIKKIKKNKTIELIWGASEKERTTLIVLDDAPFDALERAADLVLSLSGDSSYDNKIKMFNDLITQCEYLCNEEPCGEALRLNFKRVQDMNIKRFVSYNKEFYPIIKDLKIEDLEYVFTFKVIRFIKSGDIEILSESASSIPLVKEKAYYLKGKLEEFKTINRTYEFLSKNTRKNIFSELFIILNEMDISKVEKCSCCGTIMLPDDECYSDYTNSNKPICGSCATYNKDKEVYCSNLDSDEVILNEFMKEIFSNYCHPTYREFVKKYKDSEKYPKVSCFGSIKLEYMACSKDKLLEKAKAYVKTFRNLEELVEEKVQAMRNLLKAAEEKKQSMNTFDQRVDFSSRLYNDMDNDMYSESLNFGRNLRLF